MNRRMLADRVAAQVVGLGGLGVVLAVFFIAFYLIKEAAPLMGEPELGADGPSLSAPPAMIGGAENFTDASWRIFPDGRLQLHSFRDGALIEEVEPLDLAEGEVLAEAKLTVDQNSLIFATTQGRIGILELSFLTSFEGDTANQESRRQEFGALGVFWFVEDAQAEAPIAIDAMHGDAEARMNAWAAASYADGRVVLWRGQPRYNALEDETTWRMRSQEHQFEQPATCVVLFERGRFLATVGDMVHGIGPADKFAGLEILGSEMAGGEVVVARELIGRGSAILGTAEGKLSRWLLQPTLDDKAIRPMRLQEFKKTIPDLIDILPSARQRVFFAQGKDTVMVGQGTAGKSLTSFELGENIAWMNIAPREDYLLVARTDSSFEGDSLGPGFP